MEEIKEYPFQRGQFVCGACNSLFYANRGDVQLEDGVFWASCPDCGKDALEMPYMKNLHKTIGSAKGANMSPEGRAKNRLNGFTTGSSYLLPSYRGKIPMAPAKPGRYPECDGCQDREGCEQNVEARKNTCIPVYCHRKTEVSLKYASAFLSGDPEALRLIAADNAAKMQMVFNASIKKIFDSGVELIEKELHWGKDGVIQRDEKGEIFITNKIYAHPLIKRCIELAQVMGFTLADWTMTPKSREAKEQVSGFLAGMAAGSGKTVEAVGSEINAAVENFTKMLDKAKELRGNDRTLQIFKAEGGRREGGNGE